MPAAVGIVLGLAAAIAILPRIVHRSGLFGGAPHAGGRARQFAYRASPILTTSGERAAWDLLRRLAPPWVTALCPKVRLEDVIEAQGRGSERLRLRGYVKSRHVDFVLVDAAWRPRLVVEVDGPSHRRAERRARDRLVDQALAAARLPVVHLIHGRDWAPQLQQVFGAMTPPDPAAPHPGKALRAVDV